MFRCRHTNRTNVVQNEIGVISCARGTHKLHNTETNITGETGGDELVASKYTS